MEKRIKIKVTSLDCGGYKVTYFGQHFHLSIVSGDKNPTLIVSDTDETHNHIVYIDKYELKDVADFIYNYLENN